MRSILALLLVMLSPGEVAQVLPAGEGQSRFVWITDVLPDELATPTAGLMERGLATMKATLEG